MTSVERRPAFGRTEPMELEQIKAIIAMMKDNDLSEFSMEQDGLKIRIKRGPEGFQQTVSLLPPVQQPVPVAAPVPVAVVAPVTDIKPVSYTHLRAHETVLDL